jgi:replicative superfamily II helicase
VIIQNTDLIAKWLDAKFYQSKYRPIPIEEFLVYEGSIYPASSSSVFLKTASQLVSGYVETSLIPTRTINESYYEQLSDPVTNAVVALAIETAQAGYGALVFCSSRRACQSNAALISEAMPDIDSIDPSILDRRKDVIADLQSLPADLDPVFQQTIIKGVAFHHAGLTTEEREVVASAYDEGVLKIMVATCSLAAGINLPARRVILNGARMGRDMVGPAMLRQMRGRAGRKGKDEVGESYICCAKADLEEVAALLEAELPPVVSSLTPEKRGLKRALLEVIATRLATSRVSVNDYIERTLLYQTMDRRELEAMVETTIIDLLEMETIKESDSGLYEATLLGQAIVAASLTPEDGVFVHDELQRALRAFVMDGEMHIFYMFTPVQTNNLSEIVWPTFQKEMERLDDSGIRALQFVGVKPSFVNKMCTISFSLSVQL